MNLRPSVWSGYYRNLTPQKAVDAFLAADFHHAELAHEHGQDLLNSAECVLNGPEKTGRALRQYCEDKGFVIPQGHLIFPIDLSKEETVSTLKKWLDLYVAIGIRAAVLHATCDTELNEDAQWDCRVRALSELSHHLEGTETSICLENLGSCSAVYTADRINALIDAVGDDTHLGICLDVGHLHRVNVQNLAVQSQKEFIHLAGPRLKALHVQNNGGINDDHLMPFTMRRGTDWKEVMTALHDIGYQGLFNLEIPGESWHVPMDIKAAKLEYIRKLCDIMLSDAFRNS